jgi:hypothetical protein
MWDRTRGISTRIGSFEKSDAVRFRQRILVPEDYSFWDLHVAIQDAMGWMDYHLHEFQAIRNKRGNERSIGIPNPEIDVDDVKPGWKE